MDELYQGLIELAASTFPCRCAACGRTYRSLEEFIQQTYPISHSSGLKDAIEEDGSAVVELFRNCVCGSTLMNSCQDRRNHTEQGTLRRRKFAELFHRLLEKGCSADEAREALVRFIRHHDLQALEALGVKVRRR